MAIWRHLKAGRQGISFGLHYGKLPCRFDFTNQIGRNYLRAEAFKMKYML